MANGRTRHSRSRILSATFMHAICCVKFPLQSACAAVPGLPLRRCARLSSEAQATGRDDASQVTVVM
jgi:hypothetical protein